MQTRTLIQHLLMLIIICAVSLTAMAQEQNSPQRGVKICVAMGADPAIHAAAAEVLAAVDTHPLLSVMAGSRKPLALTDSALLANAKPEERAFTHLVLIGLPDDPMIKLAWQREARVGDGGLYIFGFGHLRGDIGYIESDRNPFLHGAAIKSAPYEAEVVTITGSTPAGVALAVQAFLRNNLVNGVVAAPGWSRPAANLLQHDPLAATFSLPAWLPATIGDARQVATTQASEDEYRGVLADTGVVPQEIWRVKYYYPGAWDGAGAAKAMDNYSAGLHRRAYGNTVWCARFSTPAQAAQVAPKIAAAAQLRKSGTVWTGAQPPYGFSTASSGPLSLWQRGEWVLMSTLKDTDSTSLQKQ